MDILGSSVKGLAEIQIDDIHRSSPVLLIVSIIPLQNISFPRFMTQWCENAHNSKNLINLSGNNSQVIFLPNLEKCCELLLLKRLEDPFKVLLIFWAFLQLHQFLFWIPINWIIKVNFKNTVESNAIFLINWYFTFIKTYCYFMNG